MSDHRSEERPGDLEEVRRLLFPQLSPEEGRRRIEAADAGQRDEERWRRIELIVRREAALRG